MSRMKFIAFVLLAMTIQATSVLSLDLGRALRSAAGQVIDNAVRGASQPPPQQYQSYPQPQPQQQQQAQTYSYEEYMAAQNESSNAGTTSVGVSDSSQNAMSQTEDNDFNTSNPFAGLAEDENTQPPANAGSDSDAQESDTIEVVATGIGQDSDQALKNALRAAIEQAVGTMVDSETLANNDEIVNDQILSYSDGFVKSHKVIGEPRTRDGLVTIKIQAQVKRTQLAEKLKAASIHVKEVDGESLFGEVFTALEQEQNASEMLTKRFDGFPENLLEIKMLGKAKYNKEIRKLQLEIEISINKERYRDFTKGLLSLLSEIASDHQTINLITEYSGDDTRIIGPGEVRSMLSNDAISVITQMNDAKTNSIAETFKVSKDIADSIYQLLKRPYFTVDIIDEAGDPIVSGRYDSPVPYELYSFRTKIGFMIFPLLDDNTSSRISMEPGTVSGKWTLNFDASTDEMRRMRNVVCKIMKGQS